MFETKRGKAIHAVRVTLGLLAWGLVAVGLTTNILRDVVVQVSAFVNPVIVPLTLLLGATVLSWVRGSEKAVIDITVAALAPILVLFWHIPRVLHRPSNPGPLLAYLGLWTEAIVHFRPIVTATSFIAVGAVLLMSRQPWVGLVGGLILAVGLFYVTARLVRRMLQPDRLLGTPSKHMDRLLNSEPIRLGLSNGDTNKRGNDPSGQLLLATYGLALNYLSVTLINSLRRGHYIQNIVAHLAGAYFCILILLAGVQLGVYDTWPTAYNSNIEPGYGGFFFFTMFSTFDIHGSGISPNSIVAGILIWFNKAVLGSVGLMAMFGVFQTVQGKFTQVAERRAAELREAFRDWDNQFRSRYKKSIQSYTGEILKESVDHGFVGFLTSVIRFLNEVELLDSQYYSHPQRSGPESIKRPAGNGRKRT